MLGRLLHKIRARPAVELNPLDAYDLWAATYDDASDNALLSMESTVVGKLIDGIDLKGKTILDAGCGTGRHLQQIAAACPCFVAGIDISSNMLERARGKNFYAVHPFLQVADIRYLPFRDEVFHCVISTLVLDHIENLRDALAGLCRVLQPGGTLIVSSFHPFGKLLSWQRTFQAEGSAGQKTWYSARYYLHLHAEYFTILREEGMELLQVCEPVIDDRVRSFYERCGRMDIFNRFKGFPMLLIFVARKK